MSLAKPSVHKVMPEVVGFLAGPAAALLQVAHPFVGHGVLQHSAVKSDIKMRFHRTFFFVFRIGTIVSLGPSGGPGIAPSPISCPPSCLLLASPPARLLILPWSAPCDSVWRPRHGDQGVAGSPRHPQPGARHDRGRHVPLPQGLVLHGTRPGRPPVVRTPTLLCILHR